MERFDIYLDHRWCTAIVNAADWTKTLAEAFAVFQPETAEVDIPISLVCEFGQKIFEQQDLGRGVIIAFETLTGGVPIPHWISSQ